MWWNLFCCSGVVVVVVVVVPSGFHSRSWPESKVMLINQAHYGTQGNNSIKYFKYWWDQVLSQR